MKFRLTIKSDNRKTGPIPVSTSDRKTCPDACPLKNNGCYAEGGPLGIIWKTALDLSWNQFTGKVRALPEGQLWRHNQAGDLPGESDEIDWPRLAQLIEANRGKRGFTYTHKPVINRTFARHNRESIAAANALGFTVNLSADNLNEADDLADLGIAPVVVILPQNQKTNTTTPGGRKVVICPALTHEDVTCATCQLCQKASRSVIVGFPAHGSRSKIASLVAEGVGDHGDVAEAGEDDQVGPDQAAHQVRARGDRHRAGVHS